MLVGPARSKKNKPATTRIVGVGASAGGLEAFTELLRNLPPEAGVAYVLVQHLDPTHRSLLSELLAKVTPIPVTEIAPNTAVKPGQIYVIPPNSDLTISNGVLQLQPRKKTGGPARSIDTFLQSLASDQKERAIGVILSGAGSDGTDGLRAIKAAGGLTFAQDAATAKYDSMPRSAIATNCVDFVLPPEKIAREISRILHAPGTTKRRAAANARTRGGALARRPRTAGAARALGGNGGGSALWPAAPEDADLRRLFVLLRDRTGVDFSFYRPNTIRRRLTRRLGLSKCSDLPAYVRFVRVNPEELDALYQDLLINVTGFFRNPKVFEILKRRIFPRLVKSADGVEALRFWVAGCSTGQEAYSLAMAYAEFAAEKGVRIPVQIFATDVNATVLEQARIGRYTSTQVAGVSKHRLQTFFQKENDEFRVAKAIRDKVIFAQQNLVTDPPFTRVDLVSCRNMLIYLETALQQKILPAFHYALRPHGFLVLGSSESTGQFNNLFETIEARHRIFAKKPGASWLKYERPPIVPASRMPAGKTAAPPVKAETVDPVKEADRMLLSRYAPVSVLINEDGDILQFRGEARHYLDLPAGKATFQLLKMARAGLAMPLQRLLLRAKKENRIIAEKGVRFEGRRGAVNVEVIPLKTLTPRHFVVVFQKMERSVTAEAAEAKRRTILAAKEPAGREEAKFVAELKHELAEARDHLQSLQEEYDTSIEELQASNEEVQSANEELQSLNEELETSNEELESSNEELTTLNEELATRNAELRESERRLREQAQLLELAPVLARSTKDRIIFWNVGAEKLYGYTKEEALGQTSHLLLNAQYSEPLEAINAKLMRDGHWEGEITHRRKNGAVISVYSQWVVHYDDQNKARAVLEVNSDITARKEAEKRLIESESFNRTILESSPDSIKVLNTEGKLIFVSQRARQLMEVDDRTPIEYVYWPSLWDGDGRNSAEKAYHEALNGRSTRFQAYRRTLKGSLRYWDVAVQPIVGADGKPDRILAAGRDITEYKEIELQRAEKIRLTALRADIGLAIAQGSDLRETLEHVAELMEQHLEAAVARIWVVDESSELLVLQASTGPEAPRAGRHDQLKVGDLRMGRIAAEKKAYLTNHAAGDAELGETESLKRTGIVGFAGFPLVVNHSVVGVVALYTKYALKTDVLEELGLAADALAQFVERKNAERERYSLNQKAIEARHEVEILNGVGETVAAELDHRKLAQAVVDAATGLTRAEYGLFVYEAPGYDGADVTHHATSGAFPGAPALLALPKHAEKPSGKTLRPQVVRVDDLTMDRPRADETIASPFGGMNVRSYLAVPVISRTGESLGWLFFGHTKPRVFSEREERMARGLASQTAVAMDNARLFDQLERKVNERTARLKETISELQAFSYTVSHDLRAPLRAMQSYAQVLKEECADQLNDTAKNYLHRIEHAGMRLDRLIQDVLTYGRIGRGEINLQPLDLHQLIQSVIDQYPMLQSPKATIDVLGTIPQVCAEQSSTTQCLSNLLGNAVKFVEDGVHPHVKVYAETYDAKVRLWIEDNGIGIAPEDQAKIFEMFERAQHDRKYDGTGIGLAIVRKAMERMGGQVGVKSQAGQGSRFWLEFKAVTP